MIKYDLKNVKYMHYLDYKMNNVPKYMKKYDGEKYPRLVQFLVRHEGTVKDPDHEAKRIFKVLWKEGLFHSCQA